MKEKLGRLKEKFLLLSPAKKVLVLGIGVVVILMLIITILALIKRPVSTSPTIQLPQPAQNKTSVTTPSQQTVLPAPKVSFTAYDNEAGFPTLPANVNLYTLKTNFPMDGVIALGKELGLMEYKVFGENVLLYNTKAGSTLGMMTFNTRTGTFAYQSFDSGSDEIMANPNPTRVARNFLQRVGLNDNTITCDITYERTDLPDQTFVECHRDWEKTGLPILSSLGVINVVENQTLKQLVLGGADPSFPDPTIRNTSTNQDGLARPTDYNSATIVVSTNGTVISASSNIRPIQQTQSYNTAQLLSPEDALQEFQNQKSTLSLTLPAGAGTPDVAKVYPDNTASSPKATITDYVLIYSENPPDVVQQTLSPMYLIRGTSQLSSGYRVKFTQVLPAIKNVAGVSTQLAQSESSLKLGTFQPNINPTPTTSTTQVTLTPTNPKTPPPTGSITLPPSSGQCNPDQSQLNPIYQVNGLMYGVAAANDKDIEFPIALYYIPSWKLSFDPKLSAHSPAETQQRLAEVNRLQNEIATIVTHARIQFPSTPFWGRYVTDPVVLGHELLFEFYANLNVCPLRVTGNSPTLFLYGKPGTEVSIQVNHPLTYSDPPAQQNQWHLILKSEQPYLYYEYQPIVFSKPNQGWVLKKSDIADFVTHTLSPQLALLPRETERLIFELNHAAFNIDSEFLLMSPIDQKEVDAKLPLTISPKPESVRRIHFMVREAIGTEQPQTPQLKKVERKNFMILELGASTL